MTDMTSPAEVKRTPPQTHENTCTILHILKGQARIFLTEASCEWLKPVGFLKTDEEPIFSWSTLPSQGRQPPPLSTSSCHRQECSRYFAEALTGLEPEVRPLCAYPTSPSPAPLPPKPPGSSSISSDSQQGRKQKAVSLITSFHLKCPF